RVRQKGRIFPQRERHAKRLAVGVSGLEVGAADIESQNRRHFRYLNYANFAMLTTPSSGATGHTSSTRANVCVQGTALRRAMPRTPSTAANTAIDGTKIRYHSLSGIMAYELRNSGIVPERSQTDTPTSRAMPSPLRNHNHSRLVRPRARRR